MKNFARFLAPTALLAWGGLMLYFYGSGRLNDYLIPLYRPGVALAGVVMIASAVGQLYSLRSGGAQTALASGLMSDDGSDALTSPRRVLVTQFLAFGLLVVPIWAAAAVSKDQFTATAVLNRGIVSDAANLPGKAPASASIKLPAASANAPASANSVYEPPLPGATPIPADTGATAASDAEQYLKKTADGHIITEVTDLLFASEDDTMRPVFENRTIEMLGQFMPVKDSTDGRFQLVRMFMVCCAADARPVGVQSMPPAVAATKGAKLPEEMSWTKVVGTVSFPMENGRRIPLIHATSVTPTDPPAEAMLY